MDGANSGESSAGVSNADATERLRAAGLRVTGPRVATLELLAERPHASAEELAVAARARRGAVSTQAIYDVLRVFTEAGLVRRIEPAGSSALYELRVADNHHHLICRVCRAVVDVDCAVGHAPCLDPLDAHGYAVDEAEVVYWGTCPRCAATPSTPSSPIPSPLTARPEPTPSKE
jgi:Fur family ferric uptake transcriptional regulator